MQTQVTTEINNYTVSVKKWHLEDAPYSIRLKQQYDQNKDLQQDA